MIKPLTVDEITDICRDHQMSPEDIAAQRRSWVIGELMLDDPTLTRDQAEALVAKVEHELAGTEDSVGPQLITANPTLSNPKD